MSLKILLADDSMTAQNMGKKILTDAGYEVIAVSNGAAAVKKIAEISPHLCILDIYMPGYTGLEVCERVKASTATARMPVLLTVGKMEPYKPEEGARVRADGVIVKPFEASELLRAVHRFSQRIAVSQRNAAHLPPPPPPPSTPATYERTVKLTREQILEFMEPSWKSGTRAPDVVTSPAARIEVPVEIAGSPAFQVEDVVATIKATSTADEMPNFVVATAVAEPEMPLAMAEMEAATAIAVDDHPVSTIPESEAVVPPPVVEAAAAAIPIGSASAVLPGFVDYLLAREEPKGETVLAAGASTDSETIVATPTESNFAVTSRPEFETRVELVAELPVEKPKVEDEIAAALAAAEKIGYVIPAVDPSLEVRSEAQVNVTPDPELEPSAEIKIANITEAGLLPTSRSAESEGVPTTADPNLASIDAMAAMPSSEAVERVEVRASVEAPAPEGAPAEEAVLPGPATERELSSSSIEAIPARRAKKSREMRPIPLDPPVSPVAAEPVPPSGKADVSEEIAAVLDLLGQTTASFRRPAENPAAAVQQSQGTEASPAASSRIWMAEEVALSEAESSISLEEEMRLAYAPKAVEPTVTSDERVVVVHEDLPAEVEVATAPAEEPVRDNRITPQAAVPDRGASPPGGAPNTQDLAAAMAAAFGGALPQEDLARAEETQSISEEVRRFALGDAYKPRPSFGGAAISDPEEKTVTSPKLAAAIGRVLDRMKPQIVAEILKELESMPKE